MSKSPKVSIVTIAYNQEKYIRKALDSFVMQKTDFDFEVIVADDCSSDKTPEIIRQYAKAHPHIFKPILRKKNVGAVPNCLDALQAATGTYIALCEGDDYWTDPQKLQIQVNFLEKNPSYVFCFHPVKILFEDDTSKEAIAPDPKEELDLDVSRLLKGNFIYTNSVMYRRQSYESLPTDVVPLDWYLHLYHAKFGEIGFINRVMSVYRRHPGGMWWESDKNLDGLLQKQGVPMLSLYIELLKLYGEDSERAKIIYYRMNDLLGKLVVIDEKYKQSLVKQALAKYPNFIEPFLTYQVQELQERERIMHAQQEELDRLKRVETELQTTLKSRDLELGTIKTSKTWKLKNKFTKRTDRKDA